MNKTLLIVPCYNESKRLNLPSFAERVHDRLQILFVNDGSKDGTGVLIGDFIKNNRYMTLLSLNENVGKSNAVWHGIQYAFNHPDLSKFNWYGYWDADLSTPLWEIENMFNYADIYTDQTECIFGARIYRLGSKIRRSQIRHLFGRGFATMAKILLNIDSYDSQCGAKLFKKTAAEIAFRRSFLSRWIFDVEILLRLDQKNIIEYPLRKWEDIRGGQFKIGREAFGVLRDLLKIRGAYKNENSATFGALV